MESKTFTSSIKEEIITNNYDLERKKAILAGFLKINSALVIREQRVLLEVFFFNEKLKQWIISILNELGIEIKEEYLKSKKTAFINNVDVIVIDNDKTHLIEYLGIDLFDNLFTKYTDIPNQSGGLLAGFFLAGGSCNNPEKKSYHLELVFKDKDLSQACKKYINRYYPGLMDFKSIIRRNNYVLYLKREAEIVNFIIGIGAQDCGLEYERIRIEKEDQNTMNRQSICDTTNFARMLKNSEEVIEAINTIKKKRSLDSYVNKKMVLAMKLRLEFPEANLRELVAIAEERGEMISKTTLSRLFKLVIKEAERLSSK